MARDCCRFAEHYNGAARALREGRGPARRRERRERHGEGAAGDRAVAGREQRRRPPQSARSD